jgi:hypothetical protein
MTNIEIDLRNERYYHKLAAETIEHSKVLTGDFMRWTLEDAQIYIERAEFYAQRTAQGESEE